MMEVGKHYNVKGLAIEAGTSRNKIKYTEEELGSGSTTLEGVTIIKDHEATTDNSIGKVERQVFKSGKQLYEGWVEEDGTNVVQKIRDKRLKVSVGAMVKQLVREKEDDDFLVAKGIHYMELSTTPTPGIPTANIHTDEGETSDVVECFDIKQLQSCLTEQEITDVIETFNLVGETENDKGGNVKMTEEEPKTPPVEPAPAEPAPEPAPAEPVAEPAPAEPAAEPEPAAEEPVAEPAPAEPAVEPASEKINVTVNVPDNTKLAEEKAALVKENDAQKSKIQEMEKMLGATKGNVDNGKTTEAVEKTDNYAVETSRSGKISLFIVPNADGSFPIERGD